MAFRLTPAPPGGPAGVPLPFGEPPRPAGLPAAPGTLPTGWEGQAATLALFLHTSESRVLTLEYDREGNPTLQAHSREVPRQLRQALWERDLPVLLTSGTLAAGGNFQRAKSPAGAGILKAG